MYLILILCALYALERIRTCPRCGRPVPSLFSPCPQCGEEVGEV